MQILPERTNEIADFFLVLVQFGHSRKIESNLLVAEVCRQIRLQDFGANHRGSSSDVQLGQSEV